MGSHGSSDGEKDGKIGFWVNDMAFCIYSAPDFRHKNKSYFYYCNIKGMFVANHLRKYCNTLLCDYEKRKQARPALAAVFCCIILKE
ncbi:hypothetical protein Back11_28520 [Paenibacillus baekrokdamisoli]|uniref:Uncharacterized protein n=1 Tax=Paenibacillus baekrokdamisoli TaxID=1712516 RepID=A0A3G9IRL1_9BACL|nr:hypothetical protein Back11_28520 [Paenibacillus baekrokdamisoli]